MDKSFSGEIPQEIPREIAEAEVTQKVGAVTREIAEAEVTEWLNVKKIYDSTREDNKDSIELMVQAIMRGDLVRNPDNTFKHILNHPLENELPVRELVYKSRLNDKILQPYLKGVSATDPFARLESIVCALTGQARGIIAALDTLDRKIANAIAVFFI